MLFVDLHAVLPVSHYELVVSTPPFGITRYHTPKTQLFVDVNSTVTCLDSYSYHESMTDEEIMFVLAIDIAKQVTKEWKPHLGEMSYYTYVEEHLYPSDPSHTLEQRLELYKIRNVEYAKLFDLLNSEERDFWFNKAQLAKEKFKNLERKVFPSFIKLIEHYKNDKSFQIVLRTFGKEGPLVMKEVNSHLGPFFNMKLYNLSYVDSEHFCLKLEGAPDEIIHRKNLASRIYQLGNCVIQDDFDTWHREGFSRSYAKAFPIDFNPEYKRLFLDDNSWVKPIISPFNSDTGELIELSEEYVPRISTIDMLLDDDAMLKILQK